MNQIKEISIGLLYGAYDSLYGIFEIRRSYPGVQTIKKRNNKLKKLFNHVIMCTFLNGVLYGVSTLTINFIILNGINFLNCSMFGSKQGLDFHLWLEHFIPNTFKYIWVLPSFLICRMVSISSQINRELLFRKRDNPHTDANVRKIFGTIATDMLYSLLIQALFSLQSSMVEIVPTVFLPKLLTTLHISVLFSLHLFEYEWHCIGWPVNQRLKFIENNWPYFLGFGLPLAVATNWPNNYFLKSCLFHILFPFFGISANYAHPRINHKVINVPIFQIAVWLSNYILVFILSFRSFFSCRFLKFQ